LQLFNLLLQKYGYKTRFLCAFETKSLEDLGFINVPRINKTRRADNIKRASLRDKIMARKRNKFEMMKGRTEKEI